MRQLTLLNFAPTSARAATRVTAAATPHIEEVDVDESPQVRLRSRSSSPSRENLPKKKVCGEAAASPQTTTSWLADLLHNEEWRMFLNPLMQPSWRSGTFARIESFVGAEVAAGKSVLPPRDKIFSAFESTPFKGLKVVLLGQDPYHGPGQAHGLCFSVLPGVPPPPSLRNMYAELEADIEGFRRPSHGYLQSWAEQGMLMLNASLTVEQSQANSHAKCGWQDWTDAVIQHLSAEHPNRLVFLLWGNFARAKKRLIDTSRHIVIENGHPSPLSVRHWTGCRCFSKCNAALTTLKHEPMCWTLPETS